MVRADRFCARRADWKIGNNTNTNYANQGFLTDANGGFGRNLGNKDMIQVCIMVLSHLCLLLIATTCLEERR